MSQTSENSSKKSGQISNNRLKSNGNPGTPEYYGARIDKPQSSVKLEKPKRPEPVKPRKKFGLNDTVSIPYKYFQFTNGIVVGWEWGGDHRDFLNTEWIYWVKPAYSNSSRAVLIPEHELGTISL